MTKGEQFHVRVDEASDPGTATSYGVVAVNWCLDDVFEDNDDLATAAPLTSGEPVDAVLCDEADYYSIDAAAGETGTADLTWDSAVGPMTLQLLDADGNILDEVVDSTTGA